MSSASNELRQAAETLRHLATGARPDRGYWHVQQFLPEDRKYELQAQVMTDQKRPSYGFVASDVFIDDANYIATMHPGLGLLLADWLDDAAIWEAIPSTVNHDRRAHDIARLINGGRA